MSTERQSGEVTFEHSWGIDPQMWPRFMAKVAIALGHLAIDDFDHSREAKMLRWLMRAGRLHTDLLAPGCSLAVVPEQLEAGASDRQLLCPHEHLLAVAGGPDRLIFSGIFFGELRYQLAIASDLTARNGGAAWVLDGRGKPFAGTLALAALALTERFAMFGGAEKLRSWRPRRRLIGIRGEGRIHTGAAPEGTPYDAASPGL